jgi:hypothetical protein
MVFLFPNVAAHKGENFNPIKGVKNNVNPIVRMFRGVNSQK